MPPAEDPRRRPIGVFDSGVGGLTVLHELLVNLPHEDFLYLGDTARFPYGERPAAELESYATELAGRLLADGAKLLVVACNSATSAALPALRATIAAWDSGATTVMTSIPARSSKRSRSAACAGPVAELHARTSSFAPRRTSSDAISHA